MTLENDDLEELTSEIQRLIRSNKAFLERVSDEECDLDEEEEGGDPGAEEELDEFEEL